MCILSSTHFDIGLIHRRERYDREEKEEIGGMKGKEKTFVTFHFYLFANTHCPRL